ncbi:hypothetical protein SB690_20705, partial [Bacillus sp. SIMBA_006]
ISSYNGKASPAIIGHPPNHHLFTSYSFLKLENIISAGEHIVSLYDKNRNEADHAVEVSQRIRISVYGTLQKLC